MRFCRGERREVGEVRGKGNGVSREGRKGCAKVAEEGKSACQGLEHFQLRCGAES